MAAKKKAKGGMDHEQIIMQFNQMRQEIRGVMGKIGELEVEVNEHRWDAITAVQFTQSQIIWHEDSRVVKHPTQFLFVSPGVYWQITYPRIMKMYDITVEFFVEHEGTFDS